MFQIPADIIPRLTIVVLILLATFVASKLLGGFAAKSLRKSRPGVARQGKRVTVWVTWLTGIVLALNQLYLELTWLLLLVGIFVIIVIIAFRDTLSNLAARETIYVYNQFKIGDWIQVGKIFGRVTDITWNDTILSTINNEIIYMPNSTVVGSVIINRTTQEGIRISIPLTINNSLNFDKVEQTLLDVGTELQEELVPESKPEVRLTNIGPKTTRLELLLRINNPAKSKLISSEVLKRFQRKFHDNNVSA